MEPPERPAEAREHEVREIRESDLPAFLAARPAAASMGPYLLRQRANGIGTGLVAFDGETLVGSLELCWTWPAEVRNVHVVEARREQGIGSALLAAAEEAVRRRETESGESGAEDAGNGEADGEELILQLRVGVENSSARRLYRRLGYRSTGERSSATYSCVDEDGAPGVATETEELMIKTLRAPSAHEM